MIYILTAKTTNGTIVILTSEMKKEQLREWRKTTTFQCPQCEDSVHLKVGDIIIPHFAHKKDAFCLTSFSEGESKEHLQGKQQLYEYFHKSGIEVKLEPYLKILAQRPDLLITHHVDQIPIEFQCSTIPINQVETRTVGYESVGLNPIWLLRTPRKLMTLPQGVGLFQISRFKKNFFTHKFPEGHVFLTYNPQFEQFHYYSSLFHVAGNRYIGIHRILPISKQIFPFARPKKPTDKELQRYMQLYLTSRKKFLQSRVLVNRRGVNDPFLRGCYEMRILPANLPLWIGVPVKFSDAFETHASEWQLAFVYFISKSCLTVERLSEIAIQDFVKQYDGSCEHQIKACVEYRKFLLSAGIESVTEVAEISEKQLLKQLAYTMLAK